MVSLAPEERFLSNPVVLHAGRRAALGIAEQQIQGGEAGVGIEQQ